MHREWKHRRTHTHTHTHTHASTHARTHAHTHTLPAYTDMRTQHTHTHAHTETGVVFARPLCAGSAAWELMLNSSFACRIKPTMDATTTQVPGHLFHWLPLSLRGMVGSTSWRSLAWHAWACWRGAPGLRVCSVGRRLAQCKLGQPGNGASHSASMSVSEVGLHVLHVLAEAEEADSLPVVVSIWESSASTLLAEGSSSSTKSTKSTKSSWGSSSSPGR